MSTLTIKLEGNEGAPVQDRIEVKGGVVPDATVADAVIPLYQAITDLSITEWSSSEDVALTGMTAAEAGSSREVWASMQCLKTDNRPFSFDIPHPKASLVTGVTLAITDAAFTTFSAAFLATTKFNISNGQSLKAAPNIVKGKLMPRSRKHSNPSIPA